MFIDDDSFSVDEIMAEIKALDIKNQPPEPMHDFDFDEPLDKAIIAKAPTNSNIHNEQAKPVISKVIKPLNDTQEDTQNTGKDAQNTPKPKRQPIKFEPRIPFKPEPEPEEPQGKRQKARAENRAPIKKAKKYVEADFGMESEEEERESIPYDFIFEPDEHDIAHNISVLGKKIKRMSQSIGFCFAFLIIALVITILPSLPFNLPEFIMFEQIPWGYAIVLGSALFLSMMICSDVISAGISNLFRARPTFDTLVTVACVATIAHCCIVATGASLQMPYVLAALITLFGSMVEKRARLRMLRRTYKAAIISATPVHIHTDFDDEKSTVVKCVGEAESGTNAIALPSTTQKFSSIYSPIVLAAAIALSIVSASTKNNFMAFFVDFSVIMCATAPLGLMLSTVSPGNRITKKLFTSGTALFSYDCAKELARAKYVAVNDMDIFPQGAVSISGMKIEKTHTLEEVVACAASVLGCVEGGTGFAFADFAKQQFIHVPKAQEVEYHEAGGVSAVIKGDKIICGTAACLMRRGIHITEGLSIKSGVFVAINMSFAGVFALKYSTPPQTYSAFRVIQNGGAAAVLAAKDFNLTPLMAEGKFDLRAGKLEYPPIDERLRLSAGKSNNGGYKVLALLSRNTILSFAECITAAKKLCACVRFNLVMGTFAAVAGIALLYFLASTDNLAAANPINVALYALLWYVPMWAYSSLSAKY